MINVVIPMNGRGTRFAEAGYTMPKPLIDVAGIPMVQRAVEMFNTGGRYIYIVNAEDNATYNYSEFLPTISPDTETIVLEAPGPTGGAAETVLLAKEYIDNEDILITCNSDQMLEWDPIAFLDDMGERNLDGGIAIFNSTDPKWSYVAIDGEGLVYKVAEKDPISDLATVGVYYWKQGSDFVKYAEQMIKKGIKVNDEFYLAPVYNEAITDRKKIGVYQVDRMIGLGTPEDLEYYLENETNFP